jgi:hypothetical protein
MRTLLIALALTAMACACGAYVAEETHDYIERVHYTTRGDGMQCVTIGDRTYCDSGCNL